MTRGNAKAKTRANSWHLDPDSVAGRLPARHDAVRYGIGVGCRTQLFPVAALPKTGEFVARATDAGGGTDGVCTRGLGFAAVCRCRIHAGGQCRGTEGRD